VAEVCAPGHIAHRIFGFRASLAALPLGQSKCRSGPNTTAEISLNQVSELRPDRTSKHAYRLGSPILARSASS
jgi:hypothetical protein